MKTLIAGTLLMLLALLFVGPPLLAASDTEEVHSMVKERIKVVIGLLKNKGMAKNKRNKAIVDAVSPFFDFSRMAKLSLGKTHWVGMNNAQREDFSNLFVKRLQESYLEKLDLYTDEEVVVENAEKVGKRIHVVTHLVSKDDKKEMAYKFYKTKNGWKVYDVVILGVSVVQTYRSQFSGFLKTGTYAELLEKLKTTGGFTIPTTKKAA